MLTRYRHMILGWVGLGLIGWGSPPLALAVPLILSGVGEYQMSDRDSREEGIRIATEYAKRQVLEQVGTYLEAETVVKNFGVTTDEIHTYSAGMVQVLEQTATTVLTQQTLMIHVDIKAQVDPDEVAHDIAELRANADARQELGALRGTIDQLQAQLAQANQALAQAATPEQELVLDQQRRALLNQLQANALLAQAWNDWALAKPETPEDTVGLATQVEGMVRQATALAPGNPYLVPARILWGARPPSPGVRNPYENGRPKTSLGLPPPGGESKLLERGTLTVPRPNGPAPLRPSLHQVYPYMAPPIPRRNWRQYSDGNGGSHRSEGTHRNTERVGHHH